MNKKDVIIKTAIIIGIIVVINIIAKKVFTRVDLTENKSYTLSPISKETVAKLDDKLLIKAFFSNDMPAPYNNLKRDVRDMLDDYRSYSNGNLNYEFLNPSSSNEQKGEADELAKEAQKYGIQPVQKNVTENDKLELRLLYKGLVFLYGGKQEVIPNIESTANLEYEITGLIKKMIGGTKKKVGFVQGHGEPDLNKLNQTKQILSEQYDVLPVDLKTSGSIDQSISAIIIMAPRGAFNESEKFKIDQFIMGGGNVAFLLDKIIQSQQQQNQQMLLGNLVMTNLEDMMLNYGIKINNDLVRDAQCIPVQVQAQGGFFSAPYPFFPLVTNIYKGNPAFRNIKNVILTYCSTIDTNVAQGKNLRINPLLVTSDKSGLVKDFFFLNLEQFQNLTRQAMDTLFDEKGYIVGEIYEGKMKSFYEGKGIPTDTSSTAVQFSGQRLSESVKENKIIAIGDGDFVNEETKAPQENMIFFVNMVDFLMDDVGLAEIRTKVSSESQIGVTTDETKKFIKYFNLIFPPALVLIVGLYIWNQKKKRKKTLQTKV